MVFGCEVYLFYYTPRCVIGNLSGWVFSTCILSSFFSLFCRLAHETDLRWRPISKPFHLALRVHDRATLVGPPETPRDHVLAAAKAMRYGNWKACTQYIINPKMDTKASAIRFPLCLPRAPGVWVDSNPMYLTKNSHWFVFAFIGSFMLPLPQICENCLSGFALRKHSESGIVYFI